MAGLRVAVSFLVRSIPHAGFFPSKVLPATTKEESSRGGSLQGHRAGPLVVLSNFPPPSVVAGWLRSSVEMMPHGMSQPVSLRQSATRDPQRLGRSRVQAPRRRDTRTKRRSFSQLRERASRGTGLLEERLCESQNPLAELWRESRLNQVMLIRQTGKSRRATNLLF